LGHSVVGLQQVISAILLWRWCNATVDKLRLILLYKGKGKVQHLL